MLFAMLFSKTTVKPFRAVQIKLQLQAHIVLFIPLAPVGGAIHLLTRGQFSPFLQSLWTSSLTWYAMMTIWRWCECQTCSSMELGSSVLQDGMVGSAATPIVSGTRWLPCNRCLYEREETQNQHLIAKGTQVFACSVLLRFLLVLSYFCCT